jgi:histidine kinase
MLCLNLYTHATEAAYLNGDFDEMDKKYKDILANAKDQLEKVKPYEIRILAYKAENKLLDAIETGLEVLAQLGERFPSKPNMLHVMTDLVKTKFKLRGKDNDKLKELPLMTNEYKIAAMRIMADIASSSYWATPTLFSLLIFRMVHLSLRYGNTAVSAYAFATYGVIMCGVLGDMKSGYEFGNLDLILLEKFNAKEWKTQIYTPIYALIVNWN